MVRKLNLYVMWNGAWKVVGGRYSYTADFGELKAKNFSISHGITVPDLKEEIVRRMKSDYDRRRTIELRFMRKGNEEFPPVLIEDEDDLNDMFCVFKPTEIVPLYVTLSDVDHSRFDGLHLQKMVPRRPVSTAPGVETGMIGLEDIPQCIVPFDNFENFEFNAYHTEGTEDPAVGSDPTNDNWPPQGSPDSNHDDVGADNMGTDPTYVDVPSAGGTNTYWGETLEDHTRPQLGPGAVASSSRPDGSNVSIGDLFESAVAFVETMRRAAMNNGWQYKADKRDNRRVVLKCADEKCSWKINATKNPFGRYYKVKKYENIHTCSAVTLDFNHRNITRTVIAREMLDRFADPSKTPDVTKVLDYAKDNLNSRCSKWKGYSVIKAADDMMCGTRAENYADLPAFFHQLAQRNPGTEWDIKCDREGQFMYCYFALGQAIRAVEHLRPVVVVDCAWLKNEPGQMAVATMVDGEDGCYPIAWGVLNSENNLSWTWFLTMLKKHVPDKPGLLFVSDRHAAIEFSVKEVYPQAFHAVCWHHLMQNLVKAFPKGHWRSHFKEASYTHTIAEFKKLMKDMEENTTNGNDVSKYLYNIVGVERWARVYSPACRFDIMTSNHAESLNALLNKAREKKLISLFIAIVDDMTTWFYERRRDGFNWNTTLTPRRETIMRANYSKALKLTSLHLTEYQFRVSGDIDGDHIVSFHPNDWKCTCGWFQLHWMPCVHACACGADLKLTFPNLDEHEMGVMYKFATHFYSVEYYRKVYGEVVMPVPHRHQWDRENIPIEIRQWNPRPPSKENKKGRQTTKRHQSAAEGWTKKKYKCSLCGVVGHNKGNCPDR